MLNAGAPDPALGSRLGGLPSFLLSLNEISEFSPVVLLSINNVKL